MWGNCFADWLEDRPVWQIYLAMLPFVVAFWFGMVKLVKFAWFF